MKLFTFHDPFDNPEREPTPERTTSSQERLKDEPEKDKDETQERAHKARAKELKLAAKQRGKELEATRQDAANEEIAPQGEKLRKKWRRALLKKSQQVMEFFRREDPRTIDGVRLAELMVAERIIELNAYLETTEPKTDARRHTKTELDFMGLLSEKISSPEIEVPAEILKVHQQIVEESAQTRDQPVVIDVDNLPKFEPLPSVSSEQSIDTAPTSPDKAFARYGLIVLAALGKALQATSEATGSAVASGATSVAAHAVIVASAAIGARDSEGMTSPSTGSLESGAETRQLTTAVVHEALHPELVAEPSIVLPETTLGTQYAGRSSSQERPPSPSRDALSPASSPLSASGGQSVEQASGRVDAAEPVGTDGRRFADMKTHELLALATGIAIGNGQYLRRAYESGKIDREGLIKVLKAHHRGWDYRSEYQQVARRYREQRQTIAQSPEQLSALPEENTAADTNVPDQRPLPQEPSQGHYADASSPSPAQAQSNPSETALYLETAESDMQNKIVARIIIGAFVVIIVIAALVMTFMF